nr:MAG TPA: hypothetical protein [Caudoviricetes sp.]
MRALFHSLVGKHVIIPAIPARALPPPVLSLFFDSGNSGNFWKNSGNSGNNSGN